MLQRSDEYDETNIIFAHRVVMTPDDFSGVEIADEKRLNRLREFEKLVPLHIPVQLSLIEFTMRSNCSFIVSGNDIHKSIPDVNRYYAIPREISDEYGIHKNGAHGLSVEYVINKIKHANFDHANRRLLIFHLGSGSSITSVMENKSYNTTMGFTPSTGVVMGTRVGDFDYSAFEYMVSKFDGDVDKVTSLLNTKLGLLGVSGLSSDQRILLNNDSDKSKLAIDMMIKNFVSYAAEYIVDLEGVDTIIFTGGMGENSNEVRRRVCEKLSVFGVSIDGNDESIVSDMQ